MSSFAINEKWAKTDRFLRYYTITSEINKINRVHYRYRDNDDHIAQL